MFIHKHKLSEMTDESGMFFYFLASCGGGGGIKCVVVHSALLGRSLVRNVERNTVRTSESKLRIN